jgi:glutathione S-transferase
MKLYNASLSPNAFRVRVVANELGIELELIEVNLGKGEQKSASFLAMNPNGRVPVLVDGDFVLWESRAINIYLAALMPQRDLHPADPRRRAKVDQWSYWQAAHLSPAMQRIVFERHVKPLFGMGDTDESAIQPQLKELAQFLPVLDANLAGNEWVAGDLSLADFAVGSTFIYRRVAGISLDGFPNIAALMTRLESRPSWQSAGPPVPSAT